MAQFSTAWSSTDELSKAKQAQLCLAFVAFVALVASHVPARAADACMSYSQARAAYPNTHLWWHYREGDRRTRCWDGSGPVQRRAITRRVVPTPNPVAVPRQTVLWPSVASLVTPVDAALLTPQAATRWPLLLDIDAPIGPVSDANGNTPADTCCWPSLGPSFRDRWNEMPATWFFAALKLELKP